MSTEITIDSFLKSVQRAHYNDTSNGVFTVQATTAVLAEIFRKKYEGHKFVGGGLMPMDTSAGPGALAVAWDDVGYTGDDGDGFYSDMATDIATVDVSLERKSNPAHTMATSYCYSDFEMDVARMGNYDPIVDKGSRAREEFERKLNNAIRFGVPRLDLPGFYRYPGISVGTAAVGNWSTGGATALQVRGDFAAAIAQYRTQTDGVAEPDTVLLDLPTWNYIEGLQNSEASDVNVLQWLQRNYPMIRTWAWDLGLRGQGDGGTGEGKDYTGGSNSLMLYNNDRSKLRALLPKAITPKGPRETDLGWKVQFLGRYAGLAIPRTKEVLRLEGL